MENETSKVFWLLSLDDSEMMFSLALPETFNVAYEMTVSDEGAPGKTSKGGAPIFIVRCCSM